MTSRRHYQRPLGERRYRKLFFIAAEGINSEPGYFNLLNFGSVIVQVKCLKGNSKNSPKQVLARLAEHIESQGIADSDQAWVVVDRDSWKHQELIEIHAWSQQKQNYGFALSNPLFEYWLLLHFEDGAGVTTKSECLRRLRKYLPSYNKKIDPSKFSLTQVKAAVARAKKKDQPPCRDWPRDVGSTVYRLVDDILSALSDV